MEAPAIIDGREYRFSPPSDRDQFEVECILADLLAPGAAAGVGSLADALGEELVKIARAVCVDESIEVEGDDPDEARPTWDLGRLLYLRDHLDSSDPRLEAAWETFSAAIPGLLGDLIAKVTPEVTARADHVRVQRLFDIMVLGQVVVTLDGKATRIDGYKDFRTISRGRWWVKWAVLRAALAELYLGEAVALAQAAVVDIIVGREAPVQPEPPGEE